jgi:hypothetical protein
MLLRGEFLRLDGRLIPNNVTTVGAQTILGAALRNTVPVLWVGLCSAVYAPDLRIEQLSEPAIGTNGYARLPVTRDNVGWPNTGVVNGEVYFETLELIWAAAGGAFDTPVTRMFICGTQNGLVGDVYALSAALPDDLVIDPTTPLADRTFKYRLFAR